MQIYKVQLKKSVNTEETDFFSSFLVYLKPHKKIKNEDPKKITTKIPSITAGLR